uniref:peptidylglycine monooxygenase n=1 Tax=Panagrellus redivivus TaxID=6233 RepID=A0A7E4W731_PANRE
MKRHVVVAAFLPLLVTGLLYGEPRPYPAYGESDIPVEPIEYAYGGSDSEIPAAFGAEERFEAVSKVSSDDLRMPGVKLVTNETYLCTAFPVDTQQTHYLVGFEALADAKHVHHILLFGCDAPGSEDDVWDCGEMSPVASGYAHSPVCDGKPEIIYAWAKGAAPLELPADVGYRVGAGSKSKILVLQVHYMHEEPKEDFSGLRVTSTVIPQSRTAATMLVVTGGTVPAKTTTDFEAACVLDEPIVMHPFAYRVHTHSHGVHVAGYVVKEDETTGKDTWTLLGERNPQLPQMFADVANKSAIIQPGDIIAARCTMKNDENRNITVGSTGADEMCNFYIAYYVDGERVLQDNTCFSPGSPEYTWGSSAGLNHIPKHH